jgi:hypothetical protein
VANTPVGVQIRYDHGPSTVAGGTPTYFPDEGSDAFVNDTCPVNGSGPTNIAQGDRIEVRVTAQFYPSEGIIKIPPLNITSTVRRSVIINVEVQPDGR